MRHKLISVLLIVWILFMVPMTAFAQNFDAGRPGSVSVTLRHQDGKTPLAGAELSLYHVATAKLNSKNNLSYTFTDAFKDCGCALDDPSLAAMLDVFVQEHSVPITKRGTDTQGNVVFTDLPLGLYFIKQTRPAPGEVLCTSFLVTVPNENAAGYVFDVNASPKTEVVKTTAITIRKVWNTDAAAKAADSVTVQLLRDGIVVETAKLSAQNNWQITYADMPESDAYSIVEVNVPDGFTATYSKSGAVFTVTNSASLAQTGQIVWPIPVLAMAGLSLIVVGTIVLRKTRNKNA